MQRHDVVSVALLAVIIAAVPFLYLAHAQEDTVLDIQKPVRIEQTIAPTAPLDTKKQPWNIVSQPKPKPAAVAVEAPAKKEVPTVVQEDEPVAVAAVQVSSSPTPPPAAPEKPRTDPETFSEKLITEIHARTNEIRAKNMLPPLSYDQALGSIALSHSDDMVAQDYLAHEAPDGCDVTCRVERASFEAVAWGENIVWIEATVIPGAAALAADFMASWMDSGGHRKNILSEGYTQQGIGVAKADGQVYVTVNFAQTQ